MTNPGRSRSFPLLDPFLLPCCSDLHGLLTFPGERRFLFLDFPFGGFWSLPPAIRGKWRTPHSPLLPPSFTRGSILPPVPPPVHLPELGGGFHQNFFTGPSQDCPNHSPPPSVFIQFVFPWPFFIQWPKINSFPSQPPPPTLLWRFFHLVTTGCEGKDFIPFSNSPQHGGKVPRHGATPLLPLRSRTYDLCTPPLSSRPCPISLPSTDPPSRPPTPAPPPLPRPFCVALSPLKKGQFRSTFSRDPDPPTQERSFPNFSCPGWIGVFFFSPETTHPNSWI